MKKAIKTFEEYSVNEAARIDAKELARHFVREIEKELGDRDMKELRDRSVGHTGRHCLSHEYLDANQSMLDALERMGVKGFSLADQKTVGAINTAWDLARNADFDTKNI